MADIEYLMIDGKTEITDFKRDIRINEMYYMLKNGLA
jgi:L-arabinose isomerase